MLLAYAYRIADMSLVYPVARGLAPVLVLLGSVLVLGRPASPAAMLGVVLVATALATVTACSGSSPPSAQSSSTPAPASPTGPPNAEPVASQGGALSSCPSPDGLRTFTRTATMKARTISASYGQVSVATDLSDSDPSWWPAYDTKSIMSTQVNPQLSVLSAHNSR